MAVQSPNRASPARVCAYAVIRRVAEQDAWADRALIAEARRHELDPRDRALATHLAYGTVQRASTLDHLIERYAKRPADQLDPPVRAALRLGLYQLAFLERVPPHAAVSESVELVKADAPRASGLVNAVLRKAVGNARDVVAQLPEKTPAQAALKHAHPVWVAERWFEQLGADDARALMAADNRAPEAAARVNALRATPDGVRAALGDVPVHGDDGLPEALVFDAPFDLHGSALHADGKLMAQSRAAQAVARIVDPQPGERILDLCAAPGGKTTHLAALMHGEGQVVAVERDPTRARGLQATVERMGAQDVVEVRTADARDLGEPQTFDRVLLDPPCSDLGTLASRPDVRWRKTPADVDRLVKLQVGLLQAAAAAVRPGGTLVYSTCTISPKENERQIEGFLRRFEAFALDDLHAADAPTWEHPSVPACSQSLPHRDGTDGFFVARMRRSG